jgi:malonate transporter
MSGPPMTGWSSPTMCERGPMLNILTVVLPVFLVTGAGYLAAWRGLFRGQRGRRADGLHPEIRGPLPAVQRCRLARPGGGVRPRAAADLLHGINAELRPRPSGRAVSLRRPGPTAWPSASSRSFANSVLLGLPITERAYGADALAANFAIISVHAAYCYFLGITTMEIVKSGGAGALRHRAQGRQARSSATR